MSTPCDNTKGKILRFAPDDNSKRFNLWKENGWSLINGDTFLSPPPNTTTMRRGENSQQSSSFASLRMTISGGPVSSEVNSQQSRSFASLRMTISGGPVSSEVNSQQSRSFASLRMTMQKGLIYGKRMDSA
jgi:hypothetical protein